MTKRIDNRQNLLTNLKDKNTIMLNEPSKIINKDSNKKKKVITRNIKRCSGNSLILKILKKSCDFCNIPDNTASSGTTKRNIGIIIDGDDLVELLQDTCPFKVITSKQCRNVFCDNFGTSKIRHVKCQQRYYLKPFYVQV